MGIFGFAFVGIIVVMLLHILVITLLGPTKTRHTVVREQLNHSIPETRLSAGQAGFAWYKVDKVESYLKSINDALTQWRADRIRLMQTLEKIEGKIK